MEGWNHSRVGEAEDSVLYDWTMEGWNHSRVGEAEDSVLYDWKMEGWNHNTRVEDCSVSPDARKHSRTAVLQRKYAGNPASERMIVLVTVSN
jgi:hypothetical protein